MKVADLTVEELRVLIRQAVQEELSALLTDPDAGRDLAPEVESRLRASLASADRIPLDEVKHRLGLA